MKKKPIGYQIDFPEKTNIIAEAALVGLTLLVILILISTL